MRQRQPVAARVATWAGMTAVAATIVGAGFGIVAGARSFGAADAHRSPAAAGTPAARSTSGHLDPGPVVALGDSVAAGTDPESPSYVTLVARRLNGADPAPVNAAEDGATSTDVLETVSQPEVVNHLEQAALVVMTVGANDFDPDDLTDAGTCSEHLDDLRANLRSILQAVRAHTHAPVVVTGYWNVFAESDSEDEAVAARSLTRDANRVIDEEVTAYGFHYLDLYDAFGPGEDNVLLAEDMDHPSAAGHRLIADRVWAAVTA